MSNSKLVAQGTFGCVYYPPIKCKKYDTDDYISKIQADSTEAENELFLGKHLSKLPNLRFHFALPIDKCKLNISEANLTNMESCRIFKTTSQEKFVNLIMPYVSGRAIDEFISQNDDPKHTLLAIIHGFSHLLTSIRILQEQTICHFDLHSGNVLFDETINLPIIIDFGLSIYIPNIIDLKRFFYNYFPSYHIWPIEIHYLCFLLYRKVNPDLTDIENICKMYTSKEFDSRFSPAFIDKYYISCVEFLKKFLGQQKDKVINTIITYWKTWDIFSLSFMYLDILTPIANDSPFIRSFSELLFQNIHPNPTKRHPIEETSNIFNKLKNNQKYDRTVTHIEAAYLRSLKAC